MVNNSTNVNKTNNHHSPKIITTKNTTTHGIWNPGYGFGNLLLVDMTMDGFYHSLPDQPCPIDPGGCICQTF
jgi:hypothetical protein